MPRLCVVTHSAPGHYFTDHPENAKRVIAIEAALGKDSQLQQHIESLEDIPDIDFEGLQAVHTVEYLENLKDRCSSLAPSALRDPEDPDGPTFATPTTYQDALRASSTAVALVSAVASPSHPCTTAFSACRPPGHHATPDEFMGFCLLNSVAISARYAQRHLGLKRIAIFDWDVHHGNGTSDIFAEDPSVLFIDLHRQDVWPGSGQASDIGKGTGAGYTINIPLPEGSGHTAAVAAVNAVVLPALHRFQPDLILISAGFDAHYRDPLECLQFQSATYHAMAAMLMESAQTLCNGRLVAVLEGGYCPEAVGEAAAEMARGLVGLPAATELTPRDEMPHPEPSDAAVHAVIEEIRALHGL